MTEAEKARLKELKAKAELTAEEKTEMAGLETKEKSEKDSGEKKFTQDQVNDLIKKEKSGAIEKLLKDLGVDSFDNVKEGLAKLKELEDSKKTDLEKLQEQVKTLTDSQESSSSESKIKDIKIKLLGANVPADKLDKYVKLMGTCEGDDLDVNLESTLKDFPVGAVEGGDDGEGGEKPNLGDKSGGSAEKTTEQISADLDSVFGID